MTHPFISKVFRGESLDKGTRKVKGTHLNVFRGWLNENYEGVDWENFDGNHLYEWGLTLIREHEMTKQSFRNYMTTVRQVWVLRGMNKPTKYELERRWMYDWEALKRMSKSTVVMAARPVMRSTARVWDQKTRTIMSALICTGMRFGSLAQLGKDDILRTSETKWVIILPKLKSMPVQDANCFRTVLYCNCYKDQRRVGSETTNATVTEYCAIHACVDLWDVVPLRDASSRRTKLSTSNLSGHSGRRTKAIYLKRVEKELGVELNTSKINRDFKWSKKDSMFEYYAKGNGDYRREALFPMGKVATKYIREEKERVKSVMVLGERCVFV